MERGHFNKKIMIPTVIVIFLCAIVIGYSLFAKSSSDSSASGVYAYNMISYINGDVDIIQLHKDGENEVIFSCSANKNDYSCATPNIKILNNKLYFERYYEDGNNVYDSIGYINLADKEHEVHEIIRYNEDSQYFFDYVVINNYLYYIVGNDEDIATGQLVRYDMTTKDSKNYDVNETIGSLEIYNDRIYGRNSFDDEYAYCFSINADGYDFKELSLEEYQQIGDKFQSSEYVDYEDSSKKYFMYENDKIELNNETNEIWYKDELIYSGKNGHKVELLTMDDDGLVFSEYLDDLDEDMETKYYVYKFDDASVFAADDIYYNAYFNYYSINKYMK